MPTYAPNPGHRFALDIDGTIVTAKDSNVASPVELAPATVQQIIGVAGIAPAIWPAKGGGLYDLNFLFPELRSLVGLRWSLWSTRGGDFNPSAFWSPDTTDGINGTWNSIANHGGIQTSVAANLSPFFRTSIQSFVQGGVKGLRLRGNSGFSTYDYFIRDVQIYGTRAPTGDHLQMWDPATDAALQIDRGEYGDVVRGVTPAARTFRIKNTSTTMTANAPVVSFVNTSGVPFSSAELSTDGTTWTTANLTLANIPPGGISPVLYFRPKTDPTLPPLTRAGRVQVVAGSWTV